MSSLAAAAQMVAQGPPDKREFNHGELKIQGRTMVIRNSIYPLENISTITFSDLRTPVPLGVWITLAMGVVFILMGDVASAIGFLLLLASLYLFMLHWNAKSAADYALTVHMNGGNQAVVLGNNGDFLKSIALELHEVIESQVASNTTFNIDRSIKIDTITDSAVGVGRIEGDIVNNVHGM